MITGNYYNLGETRAVELYRSCENFNIPLDQVFVSSEFEDNPSLEWSRKDVSAVVGKYAARCKADILLTFDNGGISGHTNHIATYKGIRLVK